MAVTPDDEGPQRAAGTVYVIDDEEPMRNALRRLLTSADLSVETFVDATDFLTHYRRSGAGCVLLDLNMPGMNGLQLQEELRARGVDVPIIFLTGAASVSQAVAAMRQGAVDFLEKPFSNDELLLRVNKALDADRATLEQAAADQRVRERVSALTPREKEVLVLLSRGQTNKLIARTLDISPRTVEGYRARVMEKLEANSVAQLVQLVQKSGLTLE